MRFFNVLMKIFLIGIILCAVVFMAAFFRIYQRFTYEVPIAEIVVEPLKNPQTSELNLNVFMDSKKKNIGTYLINGDQWMLEGDVLIWEPWLHFLGLDNYFRLTRLRGRYIKTRDEENKPKTIYALVPDEENWFWRTFYRIGQRLPFIKSVYGYAVFQSAEKQKCFLIFVNSSGFSIKEQSPAK